MTAPPGLPDVQVRNRGTIGGSIAEADPSGDWATVLMTQVAEVRCLSRNGERAVPLNQFITDAYTTVLADDELVSEITVKIPPKGTGAAYLAFKRAAPVYPTASAAVSIELDGDVCKEAALALRCVGLTAIKVSAAEAALRWQQLTDKSIATAPGSHTLDSIRGKVPRT